MDYVQALIRGDIAKAADISFDCIRCGLCALRCPAEIVQYNAGILSRRLYGKYLAKRSPELDERLKELEEGKFEKEIEELKKMPGDKLSEKYYGREIKIS
jgi:ferredoxin